MRIGQRNSGYFPTAVCGAAAANTPTKHLNLWTANGIQSQRDHVARLKRIRADSDRKWFGNIWAPTESIGVIKQGEIGGPAFGASLKPRQRRARRRDGELGWLAALSKLGYSSRSQAAEIIREGRVRLNGIVRRDAEHPVRIGSDRIEVDGGRVESEAKIYLILNKPRGIATSASDEKGRWTLCTRCWRSRHRGSRRWGGSIKPAKVCCC